MCEHWITFEMIGSFFLRKLYICLYISYHFSLVLGISLCELPPVKIEKLPVKERYAALTISKGSSSWVSQSALQTYNKGSSKFFHRLHKLEHSMVHFTVLWRWMNPKVYAYTGNGHCLIRRNMQNLEFSFPWSIRDFCKILSKCIGDTEKE